MTDYTGKTVSVSVRLLQYVLDFPAMGKILHLPGTARSFQACPFRQIEGENCTCNKTLFLQNRRYLPPDHSLHSECNRHVNNASELHFRPAEPLSEIQIRTLRQTYDQLPNSNQKDKFTKTHGLKGCYPFMKLGYHQFQEDMGPDIMHTLNDAASYMSKILNEFVRKEQINKVELEKRVDVSRNEVISLSKEDISKTDEKIHKLIYCSTSTGCKKSFLTEAKSIHPTHA